MNDLHTLEDFLRAYQSGQRHFVGLELEQGQSLHRYDISGTTFLNCFLCLDFSHANLSHCSFIDSNIKTCDFSHANLHGAVITGCSVESTDFTGATITGLVFADNWAYGSVADLADLKQMFDL
jgi:uncharacterized protein YjbI with pentapeptide repeats